MGNVTLSINRQFEMYNLRCLLDEHYSVKEINTLSFLRKHNTKYLIALHMAMIRSMTPFSTIQNRIKHDMLLPSVTTAQVCAC